MNITKGNSGKSSRRSLEIDGFRAISVSIVIFAHLGLKASPGQTGVLFFFVISGFVITKSILSEFQRTNQFSLANFYRRRILKIAPPLLVIIIIPSFVFAKSIHLNLHNLGSQLFFYYNWTKITIGTDGLLPGSSVVWSLSVEEQFYFLIAIIALMLITISPTNFKTTLLITYSTLLIFSLVSRIYLFIHFRQNGGFGEPMRILNGTDTRISSIAAGGIAAIYVSTGKDRIFSKRLSPQIKLLIHFLLILLGSISLLYRETFFRNTFKYTLQEFICAVLILLSVNAGNIYRPMSRFLSFTMIQLIGSSSYSIYLSHLSLIYLVQNSNLSDKIWGRGVLGIALLYAASILLGIILHNLVDRPFESARNSFR